MSIILRWEQATVPGGNTFGLCYKITDKEAIPMIYSYNNDVVFLHSTTDYENLIEKIQSYEKIVGYFNSYAVQGTMSVTRPQGEENIGIYSFPDCTQHIIEHEAEKYDLNEIVNFGRYKEIPQEHYQKIKKIDKKWNLK